MKFREIKTREVERNFDPDRRITITSANTTNTTNTTADFDPDKRIQPATQPASADYGFDPDKRIKW